MTLEILPRHFVEKPWGQANLPAEFGGRAEKVGEIWFDRPDASLPLLCKWLFTSEKLSVQVHPNDQQARARGHASGKEECWVVTTADEGATLGIGLKEMLSESELRDASLSGEIEHILEWKPVKPGDWFYIPAGTVHAIGAGVQLVEIQQNADITYRLYDYGRPRELHLEDGVEVANTAPYTGACGNLAGAEGSVTFVDGDYFLITLADASHDFASLDDDPAYCVPTAGLFECPAGELSAGMVAYGSAADLSPVSADARILIARET